MGRMVGRYELVRPLAKGGMAEVFLARRRGPGGVEKRLVVKRIRRERARDPRFLELFVHEARLSMSLAHKNIVPMFDFGRAGDELFLVMEYVDGFDLGAVLQRARERDVEVTHLLAAWVVMEACQALDYAHGSDQSVVHRDVTPRNVLVSRAGEVKLVDFGVAVNETAVGERTIRGTPAYMSPEQARGEAVDGRADVFSLGLVLWQMLTGRRAYDATDKDALLEQARAAQVPALPDDVSLELSTIVERATASALSERYRSAREMQIALDDYLVGARAADREQRAPALQLATLVERLFPAAETATAEAVEVASPDGPVVTFLEDGLDEVERVVTLAPGDATMRSIAETMVEPATVVEESEQAEPGAPAPPESTTAETRRARRSRWPLAFVAALIAGGAALAVSVTGGGPERNANGPPAGAPGALAPADAAPVAVAPSHDAGAALAPPTHDAAVPAAPVADAAPRRVPRARADARPRSGPPPEVAPGTVTISSRPWATVVVVGRAERCDETPCSLTLPPGTHTLRLHNPVDDSGKDVSVNVTSGRETVVRETLTRAR